MIVVSNTSPIINLAMINQLELLQKLYQEVIISQEVYREITIKGEGQPGSKEIIHLPWIQIKQPKNISLIHLLKKDLHSGEAETLALACELKSDLLLLDERLARQIASLLKLHYIGLMGILIEAKRKHLIPQVKPLLDRLIQEAGFWIKPTLYHQVLNTANEN